MGKLLDVDDLNGIYKGRTIVVMGTSGSIKHLELSKLKDYVVVGTNDSLEEWEVDYLLAVDGPVVDRYIDWLKVRPDTVLLTTKRHAERVHDTIGLPGDIYTFRVNPSRRLNRKGALRQLDNTSHYAVEVAWRMLGCKGPGRIVLVGVDLRYPTKEELEQGETDHSWGSGADRNCKPNFTKVISGYTQSRDDLAGSGVELITCSPWDGPLTAMIQRRDFDELMKEEEKKR
jgi:hypothetical protein